MNRDAKQQRQRRTGSRQQHRERIIEWSLIEIPAQLVRDMAQLKLTPAEFIVLIHLLCADNGWKQGHPVALPLRNMQQATGLSLGTVHNAKRGLIAKGFMTIMNVRNQARTNTYDLSPMRQMLGKEQVIKK
jgi:DNA-binding MarR family transcriptional regulator